MNIPGLVSVTFRRLQPEKIIELVKKAGLAGIEWGGDIHVPHGELTTAKRVGGWTREAGIAIVSYGSYYRAGHSIELPFEPILATALVLGTQSIRIWAGNQGSIAADERYRAVVQEDIQRIVSMAGREGVKVALEYHGGTLTDTSVSTVNLLEGCGENVPGCLWQPPVGSLIEENLRDIEAISPWFEHSHVFSWVLGRDQTIQRLPFETGVDQWKQYFKKMHSIPDDHYALLEFVRNESAEQFLHDAKTLQNLLSNLES